MGVTGLFLKKGKEDLKRNSIFDLNMQEKGYDRLREQDLNYPVWTDKSSENCNATNLSVSRCLKKPLCFEGIFNRRVSILCSLNRAGSTPQ